MSGNILVNFCIVISNDKRMLHHLFEYVVFFMVSGASDNAEPSKKIFNVVSCPPFNLIKRYCLVSFCVAVDSTITFILMFTFSDLIIQDVEVQMVNLRSVQLGSGEKMFCLYWMNLQMDHRLYLIFKCRMLFVVKVEH